MSGTNPVISAQMRLGFKGTIVADPSNLLGNLSCQGQHLICDRKGGYIALHKAYLAFLSIIRDSGANHQDLICYLVLFLDWQSGDPIIVKKPLSLSEEGLESDCPKRRGKALTEIRNLV